MPSGTGGQLRKRGASCTDGGGFPSLAKIRTSRSKRHPSPQWRTNLPDKKSVERFGKWGPVYTSCSIVPVRIFHKLPRAEEPGGESEDAGLRSSQMRPEAVVQRGFKAPCMAIGSGVGSSP
eukprot:scaffold28979_cov33-Tisochrysis_lutea.AAC.1